MDFDSTIELDLPPEARMAPLAPLGDGSSSLRTYHSALGKPAPPRPPLVPIEELSWTAHYKIKRLLGQGAQGVVYLAERKGVDGYHTNVALKLFHRHPDVTMDEYVAEMGRIARQAQRVSVVQHDNLISIRDFVALGETRVMVIEWVDGLDVDKLLDPERLERLRSRVTQQEWEHLNDVIVTAGRDHCRLKPGIAVDILRGCLAGLSALHHNGIVHCDLKPSNIMVKRRGSKKIIDVDSSCVPSQDPPVLRGTPYYMAPEQLRGRPVQLHSDIASLGYILIEMLTGTLLFRDSTSLPKLLEAKRKLAGRLDEILPIEVRKDPLLHGLVYKMVAVEPKDRFPDADAAELDHVGAVSFHRHLVKADLSTEYDRELAWWIELIGGDLGGGDLGDGDLGGDDDMAKKTP